MMKKQRIFLGALIVFCLGVFPIKGNAKETETSQQNVGFSVQAIRPESQVDTSLSFFYPALEPSTKQDISLKISNTSEDELVLDLDIVNATTGVNGNINYNQKNAQLDESLEYPLTDIAKLETDSVTLKSGETKTVTITINPKAEEFPGVKLGAVRVLKHSDEKEKKGISTNYGYTIGLLLTEDKKPYNIGGDLVYKTSKAKIINGYKTVATSFQNPEPYVIQNLKMEAKLYKDGSQEVIGQKSLENMSIAPNSSFDFPIQLGLGDLVAGKYRVKVTASNDQDSWEWDETFTISDKDAKDVNDSADYKLTLPKIYFPILIGLSLTTILLILWLFILSHRNNVKGAK
jgi:hypothetical protein